MSEKIQLDMIHNTSVSWGYAIEHSRQKLCVLHIGVRFYRNQGFIKTQIKTEILMIAEKYSLI